MSEELRPPEGAEDGSRHWIAAPDAPPIVGVWSNDHGWMLPGGWLPPRLAAKFYHFRYHAPARPDDATERARLEAEVGRLRGIVAGLADELIQAGCPICNADCVSANPPVYECPVQRWNGIKREALRHD
jgi:hypothetical protein